VDAVLDHAVAACGMEGAEGNGGSGRLFAVGNGWLGRGSCDFAAPKNDSQLLPVPLIAIRLR